MTDSVATTDTNSTFSHDDSGEIDELVFSARFLDTPNIEEIRKKLAGGRLEPILKTVASHPASMTDDISDRTKEMLDLREKIAQKSEALSKLETSTEDGKSYIPGSLQNKPPIAAPNYPKGNGRTNNIIEERIKTNKQHNVKKSEIISV